MRSIIELRRISGISFEGGRVVPFAPRHLTSRYVGWLNDPEVVRYSEQRHRVHTLESCRQYYQSFADSPDQFLAVEIDAGPDGLHVGNVGIAVDLPNLVADVSIIIGEKSVWGTGIASKAWTAVVEHLLTPGQMRKVTAGTMSVNEPMLQLMRRSGMLIEAVRPKHFLWEGREVDLVLAARYSATVGSTP
ncbi:MAG TPA: GNAT family protein [Longimicrobiales bacterium]